MSVLNVVQTLFGIVLAGIAVLAACETAAGWFRRQPRNGMRGERLHRSSDAAGQPTTSRLKGETGGQRGV